MNLFNEIVKEFLVEVVMKDDVENAIDKKSVITITYTPKGDSDATGQRKICPVALGLTKGGELVIRAFQEDGDSSTYRKGWKFFLADKVDSWQDTGEQFNPDELQGINKTGDLSMAQVIKVIDGYPNNNNMPGEEIGSKPETKGEVGINSIVSELPLDQRTPETISANNSVHGPVDTFRKTYSNNDNVYNSGENNDNLNSPAGAPQYNVSKESPVGLAGINNADNGDKPVTVSSDDDNDTDEEDIVKPAQKGPVTEI